ncbi:MAG: N-acetylornithine carbamoyltransferase [bacterium]|nr:N-acetylornithine carbamoyltransferase [bacterium]
MQQFLSVEDVSDPMALVSEAMSCKESPLQASQLGNGKTLGLIFFNPSLRTRMSTVKAAQNLGLETIVLNTGQDSWQLEIEDQVVMNGNKAEHIKEAAAVMGQYCDILGIRTFPGLEDRDTDYQEKLLTAFVENCGRPVVSLESATRHPLQSLTDLLTIEELKKKEKPKVVLTWAPHIKPLPQAVGNSFAEWVNQTEYELVIAHPEGFDLDPKFVGSATVMTDQNKALEDADFVYAKNWSSFNDYGAVGDFPDWQITSEKMALTNQAYFMHCLPVRRNVVVSDDVIESDQSVVIQQAGNRVYAAQAVLQSILKSL